MSKYPLEQVALIKQRRLEEAERVLKEKQAALQKELEILKEAEKKTGCSARSSGRETA